MISANAVSGHCTSSRRSTRRELFYTSRWCLRASLTSCQTGSLGVSMIDRDRTFHRLMTATLDQLHSFCESMWGGRLRPRLSNESGPLAGLGVLIARPGGRARVRGPAPPYGNHETALSSCLGAGTLVIMEACALCSR